MRAAEHERPEWQKQQAHHDATRRVWEGPAHRGRVWNQECRDALAATGHTAMAYENCRCHQEPTHE